MNPRFKPEVEQLEDRLVPAGGSTTPTVSVWPNPTHLTLSFAPDGTVADNQQTALFQTLDQQLGSPSVWEPQILKAFQTWAVNTNMNIGVVGDSGAAIGVDGAPEGDPRFGDIRVLATSTTSDVLVNSAGFSPAAGSSSGVVDINDNTAFGINNPNAYDLYSVLLHEAGVALSVPENQTAGTVMDARYQGIETGLSSSDIAALQALYGTPQLDQYNQGTANNSFTTATQVANQAVGGVGFAAILNADITNLNQQEYFTFQTQSSDNYTITVQSAGISMLMPQVNVFDANGNLLGSQIGTQYTGNTLQVRLTNLPASSTYYVEVTSGSQDVFGMGAYQLSVVSDQAANAGSVPSTTTSYPNSNFQGNNTLASAAVLQANAPGSNGYAFNAYQTLGAGSSNFYKLQAPSYAGASTMTVMLWNQDGNSLLPQVSAFNNAGAPLPVNIIANGGGAYAVQIGGIAAGATYYLQVNGENNVAGDYYLAVSFKMASVSYSNLGSGQLTSATVQQAYQLQVGHTQLFQLELNLTSTQSTAGVRVYIYDSNNNLVADLFAAPGQTTTAQAYLIAGSYTVMVVGGTSDGSTLQPASYKLSMDSLSRAIGPQPANPLVPGQPDPLLTTDYTIFTITIPTYFLTPVNPFVNPLLSFFSTPQPPPPQPKRS